LAKKVNHSSILIALSWIAMSRTCKQLFKKVATNLTYQNLIIKYACLWHFFCCYCTIFCLHSILINYSVKQNTDCFHSLFTLSYLDHNLVEVDINWTNNIAKNSKYFLKNIQNKVPLSFQTSSFTLL
jgi:hypothetical protein